jgi:hypothetical protein
MEDKPKLSRFAVDWSDACTLSEKVIRLLKEGKKDSEEMKILVRGFGRSTIVRILEEYNRKKEEEKLKGGK